MKIFIASIVLLFTVTACGHQNDVAFYGYPAADSEYSDNSAGLYGDRVIDEDFYIEQTNTVNHIEYEVTDTASQPSITEPSYKITTDKKIVEVDNPTAEDVTNETLAKPAYNIPKCSANATLAYDSKNIPTCFTQTADAGRACSDSRQCSSYCVTSKDISRVDAANIEGACFGLSPYTGCENVLQNGEIAEICS